MDSGGFDSCLHTVFLIAAIDLVLIFCIITLINSFVDHDYCIKCGYELDIYQDIYCPKCGTFIDNVDTYDWWNIRKISEQQSKHREQ